MYVQMAVSFEKYMNDKQTSWFSGNLEFTFSYFFTFAMLMLDAFSIPVFMFY